MKIVKKTENELKNQTMCNNFLYENKGELYFSDTNATHILFENAYKNLMQKEYLSPMSFEDYATRFASLCSVSKDKPSLLFVNFKEENIENIKSKLIAEYKVFDTLVTDEDFASFLARPSVAFVKENFMRPLDKLFELRINKLQTNNVFVIFNEIETSESIMAPSRMGLHSLIAVSPFAKIYYIANFSDVQSFLNNRNPMECKILESLFGIKFLYDDNGIFEF